MNTARSPGATPLAPARPGTEPGRTHPGVHIDIHQLSLHGFSPAEQRRFLQTLRTELTQLACARQDWSDLSSGKSSSLPPLQARSGSTPEQTAQRLAVTLFGSLAAGHREHGRG